MLKLKLNNRLAKNMSWLFILNFSNTIIPYFTFPYITRTLLPEGFGIISFSLAFISYFQTFIDYGFNLTGARKIATAEGNKEELSKIYSGIIITKFLFFLISVPIILLLTFSIDKLFEYRKVISVFIIMAFSHVITPVWLFQGLQKVKYMTVISVLARTAFMICVFTLISKPEDIVFYAILYSTSFLIVGITSMAVAKVKIGVALHRVSFKEIIYMIQDGFYVFSSSAVVSVMGSTGVFVLGLFYPPEYSGYYSAIMKINRVFIMLFYPIGQALFPYHSKKYSVSFKQGFSSTRKVAKIIIPLFTLFSIIVLLLRKTIVRIALGPDYMDASNLLLIMAILPLLSIISNLLGTQTLVASGHTKEYSRAFLGGSLITIFLYFVLGYFFATWGVAWAALVGAIINVVFLNKEIYQIVRKEKTHENNVYSLS